MFKKNPSSRSLPASRNLPAGFDPDFTGSISVQWTETETVVEDGVTYIDTYLYTRTTEYVDGTETSQTTINARTGRNPQTGA